MKSVLSLLFALLLLPQLSSAQEETPVTNLQLTVPGGQITGNLNTGKTIPLRWAESSQVACFPATRFVEFQGNHVFYRVTMPAYSELKVTVTPKDNSKRINVYALRLGVDNQAVPPEVFSATSCEASYPIYAGKPNLKAASKAQSVEYISIRRPYTILIGVAGAKDVLEGEYDLKIELKSR